MKKAIKVLTLVLILALSMGIMVGCGNSGSDEDVLIAATEPTYPPFDTTDEEGNIVGFDMDLLNAIAEDQGLKVEYMSLEFDSIIPAVQSGSADIVAAAMNITPERAEKVDFSDAYFASGKVILVKKDNETIKTVEDLTSEMKVAAQIGTSEAEYIQDLKDKGTIGEAVILNQTTQCILQLQNGDVNAVIMDAPVAEYYQLKNADTIKQIDAVIDPADMGFAVQKGNEELLEKINVGLANVVENGTYDQLIAKWFTE